MSTQANQGGEAAAERAFSLPIYSLARVSHSLALITQVVRLKWKPSLKSY